MDELRRTEKLWYRLELASWAVNSGLDGVDSEAVEARLCDAQKDLRLASEQFASVVAGLPADRRPRPDVIDRIRRCLDETHEL